MIPKKEIEGYLSPIAPVATGLSPRGSLGKSIRAVLFDVYGTLIVSGSGDVGTARENAGKADLAGLLQRFGVSHSPETLSDAFFTEIEADHARSRAKGIDHPEVEIDRIWMTVLGIEDRCRARRFAVEYELIVNPVYPMPELARTLEECRSRGLVMGIVSNAQFFTPWLFQWFLGKDLDELGFAENLQIFSYRLGCAKPSGTLFKAAESGLAARRITARETLFVGNDMLNDVAAAKKGGFRTALFAGDARSLKLREGHPEVEGIVPDAVVTELLQIFEYL